MVRYAEVHHYKTWLAGQHGRHKSYQKDNYLYCDTCKLKFRTGLSEEQIDCCLTKVRREQLPCIQEQSENL